MIFTPLAFTGLIESKDRNLQRSIHKHKMVVVVILAILNAELLLKSNNKNPKLSRILISILPMSVI